MNLTRKMLWMLLAAALSASQAGCVRPSGNQSDAQVEQAINHYVRGQILLDAGESGQALLELSQAVRRDPGLAVAHATMGDIYRQRNDVRMAVVSYERACDANPYSFRNHYNLGVLRQQLATAAANVEQFHQQLRLAVEVYLRAITLRPNDFDAHLNLGACYYQLDRLEQAEQCFRRAIALDGARPAAYTNLGAVLDAQGKLYEAISAYKHSLELDVDQPKVIQNLGIAYMNQARYRNAAHQFELAARMDPAWAAPQERLGQCLYQLGRYDEAIAAYLQALALDERLADCRRGLGVVYMTQYLLDRQQTHLRDQALAEWNVSLEIQPDQPRLLELIHKYTSQVEKPPL